MAPPVALSRADRGRGSPTFIFLHYYAGSARAWDAVVAALAPRHRCVAADLRGFGDSPAPAAGYAVGDSADDLAALVTALGFGGPSGRYVLVGHSMGGKIAMALAARRPAGLAGLVLVAPSPPTPEPMTEASRAHTLASYGDHAAAVDTACRITVRPLAPAAFDQVVADSLRSSRVAWDAWMRAGSREDISAAMPGVDAPTLVVAGGRDPVMAHATLEREVRGRIAGARMLDVADVGHLVPVEAPAELAAALGAFAAALPLP
ncbi:hydrolase [Gemmatimonadetes bacterium T265]|nr:hydrolase [Gemmatimonadetes bacterium T265]